MRIPKKLSKIKAWIAVIVISLLIAYFLANVLLPKPQVGIIKINTILSPPRSDDVIEMLRYARETDNISAVVLIIDSPGGTAIAVEEIYMEILKLREEKPVIATIDRAPSGAYYISVAANWIIAKPSSEIGNIGAFRVAPLESVRENIKGIYEIIDTGPYKTVEDKQVILAQVDALIKNFISAVRTQRRNLTLSDAELLEAKIYLATEALSCGMIDDIGSRRDAIEKAAELAGIANYGVVDISEELWKKRFSIFFSHDGNQSNFTLAPGNYYLNLQSLVGVSR